MASRGIDPKIIQQQQVMDPTAVALQRSLSAPGTLVFEYYLAVELYRQVRSGLVDYMDELEATLDTIAMFCLPEREMEENPIPKIEDEMRKLNAERKEAIEEALGELADSEQRAAKFQDIQDRIKFEAITRVLRKIKQVTEGLGVLSEYAPETGRANIRRFLPRQVVAKLDSD